MTDPNESKVTLQEYLDQARAQAEAFKDTRSKATPGPWEPCLGSGFHECTAIHFEGNDRYPYGLFVADLLPDWIMEDKYKEDIQYKSGNMGFITHAANNGPHLAETLLKLVECVRCYEKALKAECACDPDGHSTCDACEARAEVGRILGGK
jgi:hypothetical protein